MGTPYLGRWEGISDPSEHVMTRARSLKQQEPEHHLPRMPFEEMSTSNPVTAAYVDYKDWHSNSSAPRTKNSRGQDLNGHELDYDKRRTWNVGAAHSAESSAITPRHSLRHKTSSPSLNKER